LPYQSYREYDYLKRSVLNPMNLIWHNLPHILSALMVWGMLAALTPTVAEEPPTAPPHNAEACQQLMTLYRAEMNAMVDTGWTPVIPPEPGVWTIVLRYDLTRNNTVENVRVVKSSGHPPLDQSAVERVYQLQGSFKPLPQCYPHDTYQQTHTFKVIY
jgi:TonB family protein